MFDDRIVIQSKLRIEMHYRIWWSRISSDIKEIIKKNTSKVPTHTERIHAFFILPQTLLDKTWHRSVWISQQNICHSGGLRGDTLPREPAKT